MSSKYQEKHEKHEAAETVTVAPADPTNEIEAIRRRLAARHHDVHGKGGKAGEYTGQDLSDTSFLLIELDKTRGHGDCLTLAECYELDQLEAARKLPVKEQTVLDRISYKHGVDLTPEELVELDYLHILQDNQLGAVATKRYLELVAKREHHESLVAKKK